MNTHVQVQAEPAQSSSFTPVQTTGLLRRNCACGGTPGLYGECAECRRKRLSLQRTIGNRAPNWLVQPTLHGDEISSDTTATARSGYDFSRLPVFNRAPVKIQAKLTVNIAGDIYEQEANRVAERVIRTTNPREPLASRGGGEPKAKEGRGKTADSQILRAQADSAGGSAAPPIVEEVLRSPGKPLDQDTRLFFEPRFGHDFSRVRVHRDAEAAESARAINALAYTVGHHIVFGSGHYGLETVEERRLLAHELAHVVQQSGNQAHGNPTSGDRTLGTLLASPGTRVLQRDIPPHLALSTPVVQKPYFRTDEAIADLHRAAEGIARTPPDIDVAKAIVKSVYQWLDGFVTSGRAEVAFRHRGDWTGPLDICWDARNAAGEMYPKLINAQRDMELRGEKPASNLLEVELSRVEFARTYLKEMEEAVSFELAEARTLPDVPSRYEKLTRSQMHVLAWLQQHKGEIASSAAKFKIDRRAVAGAIAWEATEKVKTSSFRAVGPGKPHRYEFTKKSAVEEVEELKYMPSVDAPGRKRLLESVPTAIEYIAAIMGASADIADRFGLDIRNDPGVLTAVYQGWTPSEWEAHLAKEAQAIGVGPLPPRVVANPMGVWVEEHIPYLEEAVGFTPAEEKASKEEPHLATPAGTILRI